MIQGNGVMQERTLCKDFFYNCILKEFMQDIMKKKGKEIAFINQILKAQAKRVTPSQWKRKQTVKDDKCDICSRTFANSKGLDIHKKRTHGNTLLVKKTKREQRVTIVKKIESDMKKEDSVSEHSRAGSPSPKKIHYSKKGDNKSLSDTKKEEIMEQSGETGEREGDKKEDIGIQCRIEPVDNQISELKQDLFLAKQEIAQMKSESKLLKAHNARKQAGYEAELEEVVIEKQRFSVELTKLQSEKELLLAKITTMEKKNEVAEEVDECIEDAFCQGNCEHVGCSLAQLRSLSLMKEQGGERTSPLQQVIQTAKIKCPQCSFSSNQKREIDNHVINTHNNRPSCPFCLVKFNTEEVLQKHIEDRHKENRQVIRNFKCPQCNFTSSDNRQLENHVMKDHGNYPNCPFCFIGYLNQDALRNHIREMHNENKQVVSEKRQFSKGPCIFHLQPRGCKKGRNCDFSLERGAQ